MIITYIKNAPQLLKGELSNSQLNLRKIGLEALEKALYAVKPKNLIEKSIKTQNGLLIIKNDKYYLNDYEKIYIIGGGKASAEMALTLERIFSDNTTDITYEGIINIVKGLDLKPNISTKIRFYYATHPIPNENGLNGTKSMMKIIEKTTNRDLVIFLISGGGSALLPLPKEGISLEDLIKINSLLLASGASIHEINAIRKHISDIKGGNLARKLYNQSGAILISLIISDVVGDSLDTIASGPTVPDTTTFADAIGILNRYKIFEKIPQSAKSILENGMENEDLENPKPSDICFNTVHNYLIGSVSFAVEKLQSYLSKQSFEVDYFSNKLIGEARDFGKNLYQLITQKITEKPNQHKIVLIGTGELTVIIKGNGIGGRNQEMLLSFLDFIKEKDVNFNFLIIAANLDGIEGNSKAMGALIDNYTLSQTRKKDLDTRKYLDNNDSNSFFKALKSEIITGPTGCNVNDILIIFIEN
ncbi:MAG: glycerate kinase [Promethearchaeota archaeon]